MLLGFTNTGYFGSIFLVSFLFLVLISYTSLLFDFY
jgi:hypothetical protein